MHMQYAEYETWTFEQWEALPLTNDDLMYHLEDDVGDRASSCKFRTSKPVVPLSSAKLFCLRNSVIEDNVLDLNRIQ